MTCSCAYTMPEARRHHLSVSQYLRGKVYAIFEIELLAFLHGKQST